MLKLKNSYHLKLKVVIIAWLFLAIFSPNRVHAHVEEPKDLKGIGIDQKLGQVVPFDLTFNDENGNRVSLRQIIHTPVILAPVYLHCPNICSLLLQNLADTLNKLPGEPGKEYIALAVSFDEMEEPSLALEKKKVYLKMIQKPFPEDAWRFLTGDKENIHKLTDAVGFHFKRVKDDFEHPVSLIILAPDGKIVRYMYGADPLPFDLKLALVEASQGRIGPAISKIARFCFSYDPKGKKLVFNMLKVTGTVTLLFALSFIIFLLFKGRKQYTKEEQQG
jgi:protein SCO1/2